MQVAGRWQQGPSQDGPSCAARTRLTILLRLPAMHPAVGGVRRASPVQEAPSPTASVERATQMTELAWAPKLMTGENVKEGMTAFLEKREPVWRVRAIR